MLYIVGVSHIFVVYGISLTFYSRWCVGRQATVIAVHLAILLRTVDKVSQYAKRGVVGLVAVDYNF